MGDTWFTLVSGSSFVSTVAEAWRLDSPGREVFQDLKMQVMAREGGAGWN